MSGQKPVLDLGDPPRIDADRVTPLDAFYATPTLPDEDRRALGRLHPSFVGED